MLKKIFLSGVVVTSILIASDINTPMSALQYSNIIEKQVTSIDTKSLQKLLEKEPNIKIIDVRSKADIIKQGGRIKANNVSLISRDKLEFMILNTVFPNEKFVVHCYTGNISLLAVKSLQDMGYKNVIWYKDSFKGWKETGLETRTPDAYPQSMLYNKIEKVSNSIYVSIGEMNPGSYENSGHNNNLAFIIGDSSVAVWNASSTYLLAKAFHEEIKKITNKPVKYVILENSQMHAAGGSNYWKEQGAIIVAQEKTSQLIPQKSASYDKRGERVYKDKYLGTVPMIPDVTFKDNYKIDLGNKIIEAKYFGHAHEHDDITLWVEDEKLLLAGDIGFHQRLLPIFKITDTQNWIRIFDEELSKMNIKTVIPGHGNVTSYKNVVRDTKGYLVYLRSQIETLMENDEDLTSAYEIDMSKYKHMDTFELLGKQNIARLWNQMEFE